MLFATALFLFSPLIVFAFGNLAIERDMNNSEFSKGYREYLQTILSECKSSQNLLEISVPKNYFSPNSSHFNYYFEFQDNSESDQVILFIPGGPGGGSIGSLRGSLPYDFIFVDPRGVGCNYGHQPDFTPFEVSSAQHARDIVEVLRNVRPQSYVIYGHSYGTLVATLVADLIKNDNSVPKPKAVILEGIIGKSYPGADSWASGFLGVVRYFLAENPEIANIFMQETLPLNLSANYWGNYLSLVGGSWNFKLEQLKRLSQHLNGSVVDQSIVDFFLDDSKPPNVDHPNLDTNVEFVGDYVLHHVSCREIGSQMCGYLYDWNHDPNGFFLFKTEKLFSPSKYHGIAMSNPFDSAKYDIEFPLYYLQGTADPNTPHSGAEYHYLNQVDKRTLLGEPIVFQKFYGGGHSPMMDLLLDNQLCWRNAFASFFRGEISLESTFSGSGECL